MRASLLILLVATPAFAGSNGVKTCVLDGGGSLEDRACGSTRALSKIASVYSTEGVKPDMQILSGSGKNGDDSCEAPVLGCEGGNCSPSSMVGYDTWNSKVGAYQRKNYSVKQKLGLPNPSPGKLYDGTYNSFEKSCLYDSASPPNPPIPVCQFWSINHGGPDGISLYEPPSGSGSDPTSLSESELAKKASGCSTFRYVTHSCYAGQMSKMIYDKDGNVIPGRCGMSASPPGFTAQGVLSTTTKDPEVSLKSEHAGITRDHYTDAKGRVSQTYYPMVEQIAQTAGYEKKLKETPSLDNFYAESRHITTFAPRDDADPTPLAGLSPYQTSDYFLDHTLGHELKIVQSTKDPSLTPYEKERAAMVNQVVAPYDPTISKLVNDCMQTKGFPTIDRLMNEVGPTIGMGLSDDQKQMMQYDLRKESENLIIMKRAACIDSSKPADYKDNPAWSKQQNEMAAMMADIGSISPACNIDERLAKFSAERDKRIAAYEEKAKAADAADKDLVAQCKGLGIPENKCADTTELDKRIATYFRNSMVCAGNGSQQAIMKVDPDGKMTSTCTYDDKLNSMMARRNKLIDSKHAVQPLDKAAADAEASVESFLQDNAGLRRYETGKMRFAQVLEMYKKGTPDQIRNYLTLRLCELGDFNKPAPAAWSELKAQLKIK